MKKIWILALALVIAVCPIVNAQDIFGGETINYSIARCDWLTVNITNSVSSEWNTTPNCVEESDGNFYCSCSDNWLLSLTPKPNSVGIFNTTLTNYWIEEGVIYKEVTTNGGYFGCKKENYICNERQKCCDGLNCTEGLCRNATVSLATSTTTTSTSTTTTTTPTEVVQQEYTDITSYLRAALFFIAVAFYIWSGYLLAALFFIAVPFYIWYYFIRQKKDEVKK